MENKTFLLYKIINIVNKKSYIGWTSNWEERWKRHISPSSTCVLLRNAIQKYGSDKFVVEKLETCPTESYAKLLEIAAIKGFNTKNPYGYNMTDGGEGTLGIVRSKETKRKISEAKTGVKRGSPSEQTKQKISDAHKGLKHSIESKLKMSIAKTGTKHSEDTKRKMSLRRLGKTHSEESKQRMSLIKKGKVFSEEHRRKLAEAAKNRKPKNLV